MQSTWRCKKKNTGIGGRDVQQKEIKNLLVKVMICPTFADLSQ
jgi:hypothetical protein